MHISGTDTQQSYFYDSTSGWIPALTGTLTLIFALATVIAAYHRWTCHHAWHCFRHGRHALTDPDTDETHVYCWKHHPAGRSKRWHPDKRQEIWRRAHT